VGQLLPNGQLPIDRWRAERRVSAVKSGPHRTVLRVESPAGVLFVKKYVVGGWAGRLLHLFRSPAALREWNAIDAVRAAGIPTVEPLAVGTIRQGLWAHESWLLTREIPDVVPLDEFVKQRHAGGRFSVSARGNLARQLGQLIGRMHAASLVHFDLHAGNILVRASGDELSVWLIDLHEIRQRRFLSIESAARNLALFDHFFLRQASRSDRRRFFAAWWDEFRACRPVPTGSGAESTACRETDAVCRAAKAGAYAKRDRKWRRGNRRLIVADGNGVTCRGLAFLGKERLKALRDATEDTAPRVSGVTNLAAASAALVTHQGPGWEQRNFVPGKTFATRLIARWTGSAPARNAWEMGHALLRRHIAAVHPLACVERTAIDETSHVLLDVGSTSTLAKFLSALDQTSDRRRVLRGVVERAARLIRHLHEAGFIHESLSPETIRLSNSQDRAIVMDGLEHVRSIGSVTYRDRVTQLESLLKNLGSTSAFRATDRVRFVRTYLSTSDDSWCKPQFARWERAAFRTLWRDIASRSVSFDRASAGAFDEGVARLRRTSRNRAA
jgi:tRNA A-37 threonylcarbamoyl transferase component Bud32